MASACNLERTPSLVMTFATCACSSSAVMLNLLAISSLFEPSASARSISLSREVMLPKAVRSYESGSFVDRSSVAPRRPAAARAAHPSEEYPYALSQVSGCPMVVVPAGVDGRGLPFGLRVLGRRWGDERLLVIARLLSKLTPGYRRPPGY